MDADQAVVTRGGGRKTEPTWGRRKKIPAWIWGVLLLIVFVAVVSSTWSRWDARDVTIDAWTCTSTPSVEQSWEELRADGCDQATVQAEIRIYQGVAPLADTTGVDPVVIPSVDGDAIDYNLRVLLDDPATAVVLVDTSLDPPVPAESMDGDSAGIRWNSGFDPAEGDEFVILIGPDPAAG